MEVYKIYFLAEDIEDELNQTEMDERIKELLKKKIKLYKKEFEELKSIKKYLEGDISLEECFERMDLNDIEQYRKGQK